MFAKYAVNFTFELDCSMKSCEIICWLDEEYSNQHGLYN